MAKKNLNSDSTENKYSNEPKTDYSPKQKTLREQVLLGIKFFLVFGIGFLLLWLFEKY